MLDRRIDELLTLFVSDSALARRGRSGDFKMGLLGGGRYIAHVSNAQTLATARPSTLWEAQLEMWKGFTGVYLLYGQSLSGASSSVWGAGVKLRLFRAGKSSAVLGPFALILLADVVNYTVEAPPGADSWEESTFAPRGGGSLKIGFIPDLFYLDATIMVALLRGGLYLSPFAGVGFLF